LLLHADDMLDGIPKLIGQTTVRDEHDTDHAVLAPGMPHSRVLRSYRPQPVERVGKRQVRNLVNAPLVYKPQSWANATILPQLYGAGAEKDWKFGNSRLLP
jgi:hypothetical protein